MKLIQNKSTLSVNVMKYLTDRRDGRPLQQVRTVNLPEKRFEPEIDIKTAREKLSLPLVA
jgi:hypothetical protein